MKSYSENIFFEAERSFWGALSFESSNVSSDIDLYVSCDNNPLFNFMYVHHLVNEDSFWNAYQWMQDRRDYYVIVIHEKCLPFVLTHQSTLTLIPDVTTTAMIADLSTILPVQINSNNIQRAAHLLDWLQPLVSAFKIEDADIANQYVNVHRHALSKNVEMYHFVMRVDDEIVTSLTLTLDQKMARLDDIGTMIEQQNRGYATQIIQFAMSFAKSKGAYFCCLEASQNGLAIYQKLGFQILFEYYSFVHCKI